MAALKTNNVPFFAKNETEATPEDLKTNRLIFLHSALEHNDVPMKNEAFYEYLITSRLAPIQSRTKP